MKRISHSVFTGKGRNRPRDRSETPTSPLPGEVFHRSDGCISHSLPRFELTRSRGAQSSRPRERENGGSASGKRRAVALGRASRSRRARHPRKPTPCRELCKLPAGPRQRPDQHFPRLINSHFHLEKSPAVSADAPKVVSASFPSVMPSEKKPRPILLEPIQLETYVSRFDKIHSRVIFSIADHS